MGPPEEIQGITTGFHLERLEPLTGVLKLALTFDLVLDIPLLRILFMDAWGKPFIKKCDMW
mgnify:CR=1 FL=1